MSSTATEWAREQPLDGRKKLLLLAIAHEANRSGACEDMLKVLAESPPQFAYAYAKTGLLLLLEEQVEHYPPDAVAEWKAAIDEYFQLEDEGGEH